MGFDQVKLSLCIGIQVMIRADRACAGDMFSLDKDRGFPHLAVITAAWGLGENVVQGMVNPDEYRVFKPLLDRVDATPILEKTLGTKSLKRVYGGKDQGGL